MTTDRRFYEMPAANARRSAPAALRNVGPIGDILSDWLPETGLVLEVASGTGEHAIAFARRFPHLEWQPSDTHPQALESVAAHAAHADLPNLRTPLVLDAAQSDWPVREADAILNINMVHISPWQTALGLLDGAARLLGRGAPLILYGPWLTDAVETAPSNLAFDTDLKSRDQEWGLRKVEDFARVADMRDFDLIEQRAMPANNRMLRFVRR